MKAKIIRSLRLGAASSSLLVLGLVIFFLVPGPRKPEVKFSPSVRFMTRDGVLLREVLSDRETVSQWVRLDEISPHLVNAALTSEDRYFYRHPGVNPLAILRAMLQNLRAGRIVSGGSTITQQLARIYWPRKSLPGKFNEMRLALWSDYRMSKEEILEEYLNRLPFGNLCYGVEAASRIYFGKSPENLSPAEAAFLMVIPRAPGIYNPYYRRDLIKRKRNKLLERMHNQGHLDELALSRARSEPVELENFHLNFRTPHLVNKLIKKGVKPDVDGMVRTTIDNSLQMEVEKVVRYHLDMLRHNHVSNAATVVIDNSTREVLAYVGSGDFFDDMNSGQIDGVRILRQPGSSIKTFTYISALEAGISPGTVLADLPSFYSTGKGTYSPVNYDRTFHGPVLMRQALASSLNVPSVRLINRVGVKKVINLLHEFGFETLDKEPSYYGLGLTLGVGEVRLLDLARAYAALANLGQYSNLVWTFNEKPEPRQVIKDETAFMLSEFLADDVARSLEFGRHGVLKLPFPSAAKTGTSKNFRDNWCVGYTPGLTVGVWVGNFNGSPMYNVSGITGAAPVWRDIMNIAMEGRKKDWFEPPATLVNARICPFSGKLVGDDCPGGFDEWFLLEQIPSERCDVHVRLKVDKRNNLLATDDCPSEDIKDAIFLNLEPLYEQWVKNSGLALPPETYSPFCSSKENEIVVKSDYFLEISYPVNRSVFAIDPGIPIEYQALVVQAHTNISPEELIWLVNDHPVQYGTAHLRVQLKRGKFKIQVKAHSITGSLSDEIMFTVK